MKQYLPNQYRFSYLWLTLVALFSLFTGKWTLAFAVWLGPVFGIRFLRGQKVGRGFLLLVLAAYVPISIAWY